MMTDVDVLKEFETAEAILRGHFILSSGLHSDTYLQCARVLMKPARANRLCKALAAKVEAALAGDRIDLVVAPAMGGVVVGYEMGRQLGLDTIFCEREEGEFRLRRGFRIEPGQRVLMVEDVVTTGKSSLEAVKCVEAAGGIIVAEATLIDRSGGESKKMPFPLISLLALEVKTFQPTAVPAELAGIEAIKPGSRFLKK